jgi:nucleotide-binding universal stress UspA family protein
LLKTGAAHLSIAAAAKQVKADLIIMATHGRTGVTHLLMGSVTERVVRSAPCPVLIVRPRGAARRSARRRPTPR